MIVLIANSVFQYRNFIFSAIKTEIKGRFVRSKFGALWFVLHPLAMSIIYALVLSQIMGAKLLGVDSEGAYPIFLIAGICAWGLFTEITNRCLTVFIEYANTMKKISFPKIALPIIVLGTSFFNQLLLIGAALIVFAFLGHFPSWELILLPILIFLTAALAFGVGMLTGVLNVFARDVGQVMNVVIQFWFWLTPIVYPATIVPNRLKTILEANPVTSLVVAYQDILLHHRVPDFGSLVYPGAVAIVLMVAAMFVFYRGSAEMVDVL